MTSEPSVEEMMHVCWFSLPLALRQRWWRETDYSRRPPSAGLLAEVTRAIASAGSKPAA